MFEQLPLSNLLHKQQPFEPGLLCASQVVFAGGLFLNLAVKTLNYVAGHTNPMGPRKVMDESTTNVNDQWCYYICLIVSMMKMQSTNSESGLPAQIFKKLIEPNQDQKDAGFSDLKKYVKKKADEMNIPQLQKIILFFKEYYIKNSLFKNKKLGLQIFTYISAGLQSSNTPASKQLISSIITPILFAVNDIEQKVRFTAIKAMYYITKTIGELTLIVFNDIFDNLVKIMSDDEEIRSSGSLLNQTLKTFISSYNLTGLNTKRLIETIINNIKSTNHHIKIFLVDWLDTLNEIPSLKIIKYLDIILIDLLIMLGDKELAVRNIVEKCLNHFLQDFKRVYKEGKLQIIFTEANLIKIISILIDIIKYDSVSSSSKLQALNWFQNIFTFFKEDSFQKPEDYKYTLKKNLINKFDEILEPILKLLSYTSQNVRNLASNVNDQLLMTMEIVKKEEPINFNKVMPMLKELLNEQKSNKTSDCILAWMKFMLENYNKIIVPEIDGIIQKLVEKLCEGSSKNVMGIIENVSFNECYFVMVIEKLLSYIKNTTENIKPHRVLKHLCNALNIEKAFRVIADQLKNTKDRKFAAEIVSALLHILVTSENTVLTKIKRLSENVQLFQTLYECFCANPPCLMALCFLTAQYQLAYVTIRHLCLNHQLNYILMEEFSRVTCMLESGCFIELRMHLLRKQNYQFLEEAMSILLMILPYGPIQTSLTNRMNFGSKLKCRKDPPSYRVNIQKYFEVFKEKIQHLQTL